jgi:hypothetical protein
MCDLTNEIIPEKSFTGYKRVLIVEGRYFSPTMGIEYKEDMDLPCLTAKDVPNGNIFVGTPFEHASWILGGNAFRSEMQGRTAVYVDFVAACLDVYPGEFLVKMTISKDLLQGTYFNEPIIAGKHIDKIEPLTEEEFVKICGKYRTLQLLINLLK